MFLSFYQCLALVGIVSFPLLDDYQHLTDFLAVAPQELRHYVQHDTY
jgi:hypothetical protein